MSIIDFVLLCGLTAIVISFSYFTNKDNKKKNTYTNGDQSMFRKVEKYNIFKDVLDDLDD